VAARGGIAISPGAKARIRRALDRRPEEGTRGVRTSRPEVGKVAPIGGTSVAGVTSLRAAASVPSRAEVTATRLAEIDRLVPKLRGLSAGERSEMDARAAERDVFRGSLVGALGDRFASVRRALELTGRVGQKGIASLTGTTPEFDAAAAYRERQQRGLIEKSGLATGLPGRFLEGAATAFIGAPAGAAALLYKPKSVISGMKDAYVRKYGSGDLRETLTQMSLDPFGTTLDVGLVGSAGFKLGTLAKPGLKAPPYRFVYPEGGRPDMPTLRTRAEAADARAQAAVRSGSEKAADVVGEAESARAAVAAAESGKGGVQFFRSPNELAAKVQQGIDRLSETIPGVPVVGARARVGHRLNYMLERERDRLLEPGTEFSVAARKLSGDEKLAYDLLRSHGPKAPERALGEIDLRERLLSDPGFRQEMGLGKKVSLLERRDQRKLIDRLLEVAPLLTKPTEQVTDALGKGRALTEYGERIKLAEGALLPETAAKAVEARSRLVTGGRMVEQQSDAAYTIEVLQDAIKQGEITLEEAAPLLKRALGQEKTARVVEGGEPPGAGAFYGKDISSRRLRSLFAGKRSLKKRKLVQQSQQVLFLSGRAVRGPEATKQAFLEVTRHLDERMRRQLAEDLSVPIPAAQAGRPSPGYQPLPPAVGRLPHGSGERLTREDIRDLSELAKEVGSQPAKSVLRQIDEDFLDKLTRPTGRGNYPVWLQAPADLLDISNDIARLGFVYVKGSYIPLNFSSNMVFLGIKHPVLLPKLMLDALPSRLRPAWAGKGPFSDAVLHRYDLEVGSGAAEALGRESGRTIVGKATEKVAHVSSAAADLLPRRASMIGSLYKIGVKDDAAALRLLNDPAKRHVLNQIAEEAENGLVRFRGLNQFEREFASRGLFVYRWVKGASRYGFRLGVDHPLRAELIANLGREGADEMLRVFGALASYMDGLVPVGKLPEPLRSLFGQGGRRTVRGVEVQGAANPVGITPIGTAANTFRTIGGLLSGRRMPTSELPIQYLSPPLRGAVEATTGYNSFLGAPYPADKGPLEILLSATTEGFPLAEAFKTALRKQDTSSLAGISPSSLPVYLPQSGVAAALRQAFLGSGRKRDVILSAAAATARKERRSMLTPSEKITDDVAYMREQILAGAKKANLPLENGKLPAAVDRAISLWEKRKRGRLDYKREHGVRKMGLLENYLADIQTAVGMNVISEARAKVESEMATRAFADPRTRYQVEQRVTQIGRSVFMSGVLSGAERAVRQGGIEFSVPLRRAALRFGLDPSAVLAVAGGEGGFENRAGDVGDGGTSFGPFQLHEGGALPRRFAGNPGAADSWAWSDPGVDYALGRMAGAGANGLRGAAAIDAIVRRFERPKDPDTSVRNALARLGVEGEGLVEGQSRGNAGATRGSRRDLALALLGSTGPSGRLDTNMMLQTLMQRRGAAPSSPGFSLADVGTGAVSVSGAGAAPSGLDAGFVERLQAFLKATGGKLTSGRRSTERQTQLWNAALMKYGSVAEARKWVAPPGHSKHETGMAADISWGSPEAQAWAHRVAREYGVWFPLGNEPWHAEPIGSRG